MTDPPPAPVIPAASLILMRARAGRSPEILFIERARTLRFGGGAIAFPGGRVDPGDEALATLYPALDPTEVAARIAALRETWEETGIALGFDPAGGDAHAAIAAARPDLTLLAPFARWRPPAGATRRFDTRFYVAAAPEAAEPRADGSETARAFWDDAATIARRVRDGEEHALFPTRRLLDRLALFRDAATAAADHHSGTGRIIDTRVERRDNGDWLCIATDAGYPITEERITPGMRG